MNVLYITVDALREDHVNPDVMPFANRFTDDSVEYTGCYANGPGTPWSFPTLLGSRYAASTDGFGIPDEDDLRPTLAEVLRNNGYVTAGFTDNRFASSDYNYDRGIDFMWDAGATSSDKRLKQAVRTRFDQDGILYQALLRGYHLIDDLVLTIQDQETRFARAETVIDRFLEWRAEQADEWFAWVHPMDTHAPYEAPPEYQRRYLDEPAPRRTSQKLATKATHHPEEMDDDEWKLQQKLYKAECRYLDDQLKRLFESLPDSVKENTLIVFTADHGEMHGEHGLGGHPQEFWEEVIHVPCAIATPGSDPTQINDQIGLVDLPPTVLDALEISIPETWDGRSILPADDGSIDEREHVFVDVEAELNHGHVGARRADHWKLMRQNDEELLIDLNTNPSEIAEDTHSRADTEEYRELTDALEDHLAEMERRRSGGVNAVEDEELIEDHLRELGYLE
jgi:arylsulfatase A-like enzyme